MLFIFFSDCGNEALELGSYCHLILPSALDYSVLDGEICRNFGGRLLWFDSTSDFDPISEHILSFQSIPTGQYFTGNRLVHATPPMTMAHQLM